MDETIDTVKDALKPWVIPTVVGIVSFLGGVGVGYLIEKRRVAQRFLRLENMVLELANADRVDTTNMTVVKYNTGDPDFDKALAEEDTEARGPRRVISSRDPRQDDPNFHLSGAPPRPDPMDDDVPHQPHRSQTHPFERLELDRMDWNYEAELSTRTPTAPYILHRDEFFGEEMGYDQDTWTYYVGDDILVDETDTPVYNFQENTGELRWGHGSGDPMVVYIRNEDLKAEYEVIRNEGHYSVEVLGLELEERMASEDLKHSKQHKFRDSD